MTQFKREKIDSIMQIAPMQITRENLRYMHGTGQEIASKNSQGNKDSHYRTGVQTALGDVEVSLWMELVQKLIEKENDQEIFGQLLEWEKAGNCIPSKTSNDILCEAMQSYTYRIYDNKGWWDYVRFNMKYRPEILENDPDLMYVRLACCDRTSRIPREQIRHHHEEPETVPCPYCNRSTKFTLPAAQLNNHQYSWSVNDNGIMTVWEDNTIMATIADCYRDEACSNGSSLDMIFKDVVYELRDILIDE